MTSATNPASPDLVDRVKDRSSTAALAGPRGKTVFDLIREMKPQFAIALPAAITPERFTRIAITTLRTNPRLVQCDQQSLLGALMLSAQLGLEPGGPLGHAWFVPFGREVTFIIGYRGLIDLARRSGAVSSIYAEAVFEGDEFSQSLGLHRDIHHIPTAAEREDPTKITHVYAVARFRDEGAEPAFVVLTRGQVEKFRARSKAKSNGPWVTDWTAMALKTAVRRLSAWLPMSVETARALASDEQVITKLDVDPDDFIDVEGEDVDQVVAEPESEAAPGDSTKVRDEATPSAEPTTADASGPATFDCDTCEGSGTVNGAPCGRCAGTGTLTAETPVEPKAKQAAKR